MDTTLISDRPAPTLVVAMGEMLIADALSRLLGEAGFRVVGTFAEVQALVVTVERVQPDLVLIDPVIEGHDGRSSTLAHLQAAQVSTKLVLLTTRVDTRVARALVRYGAEGLVLRSSPTAKVVSVLLQVADGQVVFPGGVMAYLSWPDVLAGLSERQRDVLELVASGASNAEIGARLCISPNTVKFHLREIYVRLGVRNRVEAARALQERFSGDSTHPVPDSRVIRHPGSSATLGGSERTARKVVAEAS